MMLLVLLGIILVLLTYLYYHLTYNFDYWKKNGVPGPKPLPLLGTFPCTITGKRNFIYDIDEIYRSFKDKARFVGVFMTRNPQLLILDPELAREILVNNFKNFMDNESSKWMDKDLEPIAGGNPFVLRGNDWKVKRSEIALGLSQSRVKSMYPIMDRTAAKLVAFLKENQDDSISGIETKELAMKFTGEVVADVGWGIEAGAFTKNKDCTFVSMSKRMIRQTFNAFAYYFVLSIFPFIRKLLNVRFFPVITDDFFTHLTEASCELRKNIDDRQDLLSHLLQLKEKKGLSVSDLVAHKLTFLFDGFETSACVISHCLLLLARDKRVQDKLRKEIMDRFPDVDQGIPFDELIKLPYLDQVLNETLRIFVPLAFMAKICTEPCELTNTDGSKYLVRLDDIVLISIFSYHHDEEYYPESEKFIPERFDEENGGVKKYKDLGVFFPFGDGPRICLGMKFGLSQTKAAVAAIIRHFELTLDEERTIHDNTMEPKGFILNLKGGIYIRYKELPGVK